MGDLLTILIVIYVIFYHFKHGFRGFILNILGTFSFGASINSIIDGEFFAFLLFLLISLLFYGLAPLRRKKDRKVIYD